MMPNMRAYTLMEGLLSFSHNYQRLYALPTDLFNFISYLHFFISEFGCDSVGCDSVGCDSQYSQYCRLRS